MLISDGVNTYTIKGIFEYDPDNMNYEDGDLVYLPGSQELYVYHRDVGPGPIPHLHPIWYKDVVSDIRHYIVAELMRETNASVLSQNPMLGKPVSMDILASILNYKFGTGVITKDGNDPIDLNRICKTGRYLLIIGHINDAIPLPSGLSVNVTNYPQVSQLVFGLDVWASRVYDTSNSNKLLKLVIRQTLFFDDDTYFHIATRKGEVVFPPGTVISFNLDNITNTYQVTPEEMLNFQGCCDPDVVVKWDDWLTMSQTPVALISGYYVNRVDNLIASFNHIVNGMVLGVRVPYSIESIPSGWTSTPDGTTAANLANVRLVIDLSNLPLSLHSLSQISAVSINALMKIGNDDPFVVNYIVPIPNMALSNSTNALADVVKVYSGTSAFYVVYRLNTLLPGSNYGAELNIMSRDFNKLIRDSDNKITSDAILDVVLLT